MQQISKKYKIILLIASLAILIVVFGNLIFQFLVNSAEISYTTLHFDKNKKFLFLNNMLLWDTGADGSVIYEDRKDEISNKILFSYAWVIDYFNVKRLHRRYFSSQFKIADSLNINNFCFVLIEPPNKIRFYNEIGIIGMDVINKANWIIDFTSEKIDILPQNAIHKTQTLPQLTLRYEQSKIPKTQLDFMVGKFEEILIDAGSNSELTLLKSDIENINQIHKPVDTFRSTYSGLFSTDTATVNYIYDSIRFNNICFNNITITEGNKRMIGFKFFKRFNNVFLNTKEKEFCFYE